MGDSRLGGGAVAVAAMSVSVGFGDSDRNDKGAVRSADSNREVEGEEQERVETNNVRRREKNVET